MLFFESIWLSFYLFPPTPSLCQRKCISQTYSPHPARDSFRNPEWWFFCRFFFFNSFHPSCFSKLTLHVSYSVLVSTYWLSISYIPSTIEDYRARSFLTKHLPARCLLSPGGGAHREAIFFSFLPWSLPCTESGRTNHGMRDSSILVIKKVGWNCISVHFGYIQDTSHKRQVMDKQNQLHFVMPASSSLVTAT